MQKYIDHLKEIKLDPLLKPTHHSARDGLCAYLKDSDRVQCAVCGGVAHLAAECPTNSKIRDCIKTDRVRKWLWSKAVSA